MSPGTLPGSHSPLPGGWGRRAGGQGSSPVGEELARGSQQLVAESGCPGRLVAVVLHLGRGQRSVNLEKSDSGGPLGAAALEMG